jgi:hypothetical protein
LTYDAGANTWRRLKGEKTVAQIRPSNLIQKWRRALSRNQLIVPSKRGSVTADQQETCTKMRAPLEVMRSILDALLDISLLDSGSVTVKRTDFALAPLLERVGTDLRPLA